MKCCWMISLLVVISCSPSIPENVLPPSKMQTILWDIMRADEMAGYNSSMDTTMNRLQTYTDYYQQILAIHHVSKEKLKSSLLYYQNHPVLFRTVLDSLQNYAERQQKKADSSTWSKPAGVIPPGQNVPHYIDSLKKRKSVLWEKVKK